MHDNYKQPTLIPLNKRVWTMCRDAYAMKELNNASVLSNNNSGTNKNGNIGNNIIILLYVS